MSLTGIVIPWWPVRRAGRGRGKSGWTDGLMDGLMDGQLVTSESEQLPPVGVSSVPIL